MAKTIEESISDLVKGAIQNATSSPLIPVQKFASSHNLSMTTIWRQEKAGAIKITRVGRKRFVNLNQFAQ